MAMHDLRKEDIDVAAAYLKKRWMN